MIWYFEEGKQYCVDCVFLELVELLPTICFYFEFFRQSRVELCVFLEFLELLHLPTSIINNSSSNSNLVGSLASRFVVLHGGAWRTAAAVDQSLADAASAVVSCEAGHGELVYRVLYWYFEEGDMVL